MLRTLRSARRLRTLALGLAAFAAAWLALGADAARAAPGGPAGSCAETYLDGLADVREGVFSGLAPAALSVARAGDPSLPGAFAFAPPAGRRTAAEEAALRAANALARRRGAAGTIASADDRWIAERVRADLADYLAQGPSPYLCENVSFFLSVMREQLGRISGSAPAARAAHLDSQGRAAEAATRAALAAMAPAPLPRFAPADRPNPPPIAGLRTGAGAEREAHLDPTVTHGVEPGGERRAALSRPAPEIRQGPRIDPDLPPLATLVPEPLPLASEADRLAALDRLVAAARVGGVWRELAAGARPATHQAGSTPSRPVVARLIELKGLVTGPRAAVTEQEGRASLVFAFSAIEALDYLMLAKDAPADPTLDGLEATMRAIEAAHRDACRCAP